MTLLVFYVFNNKHWFKWAMLFCLNSRNDNWLFNKLHRIFFLNCLFHICMLKLDEGHMNAIHVQMMNQQDLIKVFPLLWTSINGYLYKQKHGSHINTFKKDKINDLFNTIYFFGGGGWFPYIEKLFMLENYLDKKNCFNWKISFKNYLHWKTTSIQKTYLYWKNCQHWKLNFIEKKWFH
jgi:hypothetical protein